MIGKEVEYAKTNDILKNPSSFPWFYNGRMDCVIKERIEWIKKVLPKSDLLLDLGSGSGWNAKHLIDCGHAKKITCVDKGQEQCDYYYDNNEDINIYWHYMDVEETSFMDEMFDNIISIEHFEHLGKEKLKRVIAKYCKTLKKGGYFIGTCPMTGKACDENKYHPYEPTVAFLIEEFKKNGCETITCGDNKFVFKRLK